MTQSTAIEILNLSICYKSPTRVKVPFLPISVIRQISNTAVNNVSVTIKSNRITALLGKNGSGKTSIIKSLIGFKDPSQGEVRIFGKSPRDVANEVGFCFGGSLIYHRLTARENLEFFGKLYGVKDLKNRIEELAKQLELSENLDQMVESFSYGMKAKVALARALLHRPKLIILDEPTLGIDFEMATLIRRSIKTLNCTILLTTHYMEEVEELADDIIIIDHGKIIFSGTREETLSCFKAKSISEAFHLALQPLTKSAA